MCGSAVPQVSSVTRLFQVRVIIRSYTWCVYVIWLNAPIWALCIVSIARISYCLVTAIITLWRWECYPVVHSARQLVQKGNLDFLVMDYLSEITMSLLVAAQNKNKVNEWANSIRRSEVQSNCPMCGPVTLNQASGRELSSLWSCLLVVVQYIHVCHITS